MCSIPYVVCARVWIRPTHKSLPVTLFSPSAGIIYRRNRFHAATCFHLVRFNKPKQPDSVDHFHPVLSSQVFACEFIYLVSEQSAFFCFFIVNSQYWSYKSRSSWLPWLLRLLFSLRLCLYQSLSLFFPAHLCPLSVFVFSSSIPVSFFPLLSSPFRPLPPALLVLKNDFAHLDRAPHACYTISLLLALIKNRAQHRESELVKTCLPLQLPLVSPPRTLVADVRNGCKTDSETLATKWAGPSLFCLCSACVYEEQ